MSDDESHFDSLRQRNTIFHDGSVFSFHIRDGVLFAFCLHVSTRHGGKLSKKYSCELTPVSGCRLRLVRAASCRDWRNGRCVPTALVEVATPGNTDPLYYTVILEVKSSSSKKARLLATRKISLHTVSRPASIHLLPGPTLVWSDENSIHATSAEELLPASAALEEHFGQSVTDTQILGTHAVCRTFVIIGTCHISESNSSNSGKRFFIMELVFSPQKETCHSFLKVSDHVPEDYVETVTDVFIVDMKWSRDRYHSFLFLCVSEGYVVGLRNGRIVGCVPLAVDLAWQSSAQLSFLAVLQSTSLGEVALVHSGNNNCVAVQVCKDKVLEQWSGVQQVAVGDMLQTGASQLLLLFSQFSVASASGPWLLTDLLSCIMNRSEGLVLETETESVADEAESAKAAAAALWRNLTMLTARVAERERALMLKDEFIKSTLLNLQSVTHFQDSSHLAKIPVVTLVEGFQRERGQSQQAASLAFIRVEETWHRVVEQDWVVAAEITNVSCQPIARAFLYLVACKEAGTTELTSRSLWRQCHDQQGQNVEELTHLQAKRPKLDPAVWTGQWTSGCQLAPGQTATLTCSAVPLPHNPAPVSALIFCHAEFKESPMKTSSTEPSSTDGTDPGRSYDFYCGSVTLSSHDILQQTLQVQLGSGVHFQELQKALATLDAVQSDHALTLTSPLGGLSNLGGWLTERAGFLCVQQASLYVQQKLPALALVRIRLSEKVCGRQTNIVASTRDEGQLSLLLLHLHACLPDGITFQPQHPNLQVTKQQCFASLQREIVMATQVVYKLLQQQQQQLMGSTPGQSCVHTEMEVEDESALGAVRADSSSTKGKTESAALTVEAVQKLRDALRRQQEALVAVERDATIQGDPSESLALAQCQMMTDGLLAASLDD